MIKGMDRIGEKSEKKKMLWSQILKLNIKSLNYKPAGFAFSAILIFDFSTKCLWHHIFP